MDLAVEEGARSEHHRAAAEPDADLRDRAHDPIAFDHQIVHGLLEQPQIGLVLEHAANRSLVEHTIGLRPGGTHGGPLRAVEDTKLDAAFIGGQRHGASQGIDFLDQMAFANAADRRVATHLTQGLDVVRQQQGLAAHAGGRQRSLGTGVAATDHDHIKNLGIKHRGTSHATDQIVGTRTNIQTIDRSRPFRPFQTGRRQRP